MSEFPAYLAAAQVEIALLRRQVQEQGAHIAELRAQRGLVPKRCTHNCLLLEWENGKWVTHRCADCGTDLRNGADPTPNDHADGADDGDDGGAESGRLVPIENAEGDGHGE